MYVCIRACVSAYIDKHIFTTRVCQATIISTANCANEGTESAQLLPAFERDVIMSSQTTGDDNCILTCRWL